MFKTIINLIESMGIKTHKYENNVEVLASENNMGTLIDAMIVIEAMDYMCMEETKTSIKYHYNYNECIGFYFNE